MLIFNIVWDAGLISIAISVMKGISLIGSNVFSCAIFHNIFKGLGFFEKVYGAIVTNFIPGIRLTVRAVVISADSLLVQHKVYKGGHERFCLPGGAPEQGETLEEALKRECLEEIGVAVTLGPLLHVADFFKPRETKPPSIRQQVEILFSCTVPDDYQPHNGPEPDKHQGDVLWLPFNDPRHKKFFPEGFSHYLIGSITEPPTYLGLINGQP